MYLSAWSEKEGRYVCVRMVEFYLPNFSIYFIHL